MKKIMVECFFAAPGGCLGLIFLTILDVWEWTH